MINTKNEVTIFWFRRDLRLDDNCGLYQSLKGELPVLPVFIFDRDILSKLDNKKDARVSFIYDQILSLNERLQAHGSSLLIFNDTPINAFKDLVEKWTVKEVFTNHDYEPYAVTRDTEIAYFLKEKNIKFNTFKDQVIFEKTEVVKDDGKPYTVFTPYMRKWKAKFFSEKLIHFSSHQLLNNTVKIKPIESLAISELGFEKNERQVPPSQIPASIIASYDDTRDIPSIQGTSRMSVHLRFGTISIRQLVGTALEHTNKYFDELIWREFYMMVLWHFPQVENKSFKTEYDNIQWRNNEDEFRAWCDGRTGYPIVDAGMRELNETGFMHNRVRMITASFLVKHLLIDWRWGEAYFAEKLLDYELSANNGGWQWAASSGCDAVPYFRIFNPELQQKKFDPENIYIRKWIPDYKKDNYIDPIVDHVEARERVLKAYKKALSAK